MKCWLHKWEKKRVFCLSLFDVVGYECRKCKERKLRGSNCASHLTWNQAIAWRDQEPKPTARILKMVK